MLGTVYSNGVTTNDATKLKLAFVKMILDNSKKKKKKILDNSKDYIQNWESTGSCILSVIC